MEFRITNIFSKPYPLCVSLRSNLLFLFAFSLVVPFFLIVFQPFGLNRFQSPYKNLLLLGVGPASFVPLFFSYLLFPRLLVKVFDEESWSVGKETIWQVWNWLLLMLGIALYWYSALGLTLSSRSLFIFFKNGLWLTLFLAPICVLTNYVRLLKRRLRNIDRLNDYLTEGKREQSEHTLILTSDNGHETVRVHVGSLLYIRSRDNYADIVCQNNGVSRGTLIRSSLKSLTAQISTPAVVRCHRSYIVNLHKVVAVAGNARDFMLKLEATETRIPVARTSAKNVAAALQTLNAGQELQSVQNFQN